MGIVSRTADLFYAFRFLKLLVTPWDKTGAFEQGIIDENGKNLKKAKELTTPEEKEVYTVFHRLVFNLKRLLNKVPFGKSRLASYAAALFLIKENTDLTEDEIRKVLEEILGDLDESLSESVFYIKDEVINPGRYKLTSEMASTTTGEIIARSGDEVLVTHHSLPYGRIFETPIYKVTHLATKQKLYVSSGDMKR
jgi:hypothetical protein|tara:strand:+ start:788 stop:1372 length:585 start_codon:yes stop_codon:yes gene_type:complete